MNSWCSALVLWSTVSDLCGCVKVTQQNPPVLQALTLDKNPNLHLLEVQWCQQNKASSSQPWKPDLKITLKQTSQRLLLLGVLMLFGETLFPVHDWLHHSLLYPRTERFTVLGPLCWCLSERVAVDTHDEAGVCSPAHMQYSTCRVSVVSNDFSKHKAWSELSLQKNGKHNPQFLAGEIRPF